VPGPGLELVGEEELAEVRDVLLSGFLNRYGPDDDPRFEAKVRTFESEVAERAGVRHALGVNSGTSALYIALTALGVGPGDEVIVPGFTYVASISSIVYARAVPVLAEVDESFNLDPADVERKITPRTRAIVAVHMLGSPARLHELGEVAARHGIPVIEDCAQAFGATYEGRWVGSHGVIGTYSFNIFKTITCGDGGLLVTDDEDLYRRCFAMHDQGHSPHRLGVEVGQRPFLGLNFRLVELQAAVLLAQLKKLDRIVSHMRRNRDIVKDAVEGLPGLEFRVLADPAGDLATHLVLVFPSAEVAEKVAADLGAIRLSESGWHVYTHMEHLLEKRTITGRGCPFDCQEHARRDLDYFRGMLPRTDALLERSISVGIGVVDPNLSPFGLGISADEERARNQAAILRRVAEQHLA
jgi:dTDP-4-amino-4,6-dideoxygalactose transaminase